jgi:hypothetical protein
MKKKTVILIAAIVLGLVYGWVSAQKNHNPYYPVPGEHHVANEELHKAWHWEPSSQWLPGYLLCKVAKNTQGNWAGVTYTKSGYLFRNRFDLWVYRIACTIIGGVMGMLLGYAGTAVQRGKEAKTRPVEPADQSDSR